LDCAGGGGAGLDGIGGAALTGAFFSSMTVSVGIGVMGAVSSPLISVALVTTGLGLVSSLSSFGSAG